MFPGRWTSDVVRRAGAEDKGTGIRFDGLSCAQAEPLQGSGTAYVVLLKAIDHHRLGVIVGMATMAC